MHTKDVIQRYKGKIRLNSVTSESVHLGIFLAIVGGFLDAYTFVGRGGVFANAQTGNIVLVGVEVSRGDWRQAFMYVPPILAFILGVIVAEIMKKRSSLLFIPDSARAILILEIILLFIIGFLPSTVSDSFVNVIISFVSSVQISAFRKLVDSPYSTTMTTGNLRTASYQAYIAITKKDRESAIRALRYLTIISSFLFGAFLGGMVTLSIGNKAIWVAAFILIFSLILFSIDERISSSV
ncbi:YoaK family protein [Romboutsia sp.]|uniref:YoaK family protein n=1 Tax=Romboutsia sp. TaxID=1965302 RepID=UPI002C8D7619|nr:YoaK family protein [Romboutsia sp.]HSQ87712.1 YoaK family protein [Romboutsia sp.]